MLKKIFGSEKNKLDNILPKDSKKIVKGKKIGSSFQPHAVQQFLL